MGLRARRVFVGLALGLMVASLMGCASSGTEPVAASAISGIAGQTQAQPATPHDQPLVLAPPKPQAALAKDQPAEASRAAETTIARTPLAELRPDPRPREAESDVTGALPVALPAAPGRTALPMAGRSAPAMPADRIADDIIASDSLSPGGTRGFKRVDRLAANPSQVVVTPVATILAHGQPFQPVAGGYGVLLLKKGEAINKAACEAFFASLPYTDEPGQTANRANRPTYWIDSLAKGAAPRPCDRLLETYAFDAAHEMLIRLGVFDARGPVLAAYRQADGKAFVLDLSRCQTEADISDMLNRWKHAIISDPELWQVDTVEKGLVRYQLMDYARRVGGAVLRLIEVAAPDAWFDLGATTATNRG